LACVLIVLYAAVERFGSPKALITDNGGVFQAKQLLAICEALDIEKEYIHPRQSWENLVETHLYGIWNLENSQITCIMWTARNLVMRTLVLRQDWGTTGHLSLAPDASDKEAKAARLRRYAELRWSPDASLRSQTGGH
jgi:transposase InsO family protein